MIIQPIMLPPLYLSMFIIPYKCPIFQLPKIKGDSP
jgi:hypothetical protein